MRTMLKGIDISNWQAGLAIPALQGVDFVIVKATEGDYFIDPYCDGWVQSCKTNGKLWGFYHFANENDPFDEADFFVTHTRNYFGQGIPVLDWEGNQSVDWVNTFVRRIKELTGVWPWIYANPWRFNQGGVESNCARWVASYPDVIRPTLDYDPGEPPATDGLIACWQYASDGQVPGYAGNLDVNHFYGNSAAWELYTGRVASEQPQPEPETPEKIVLENVKKITIER